MSGEAKDPAIKLFGKTIPLPDISPTVACAAVDDNDPVLPLTCCSSPEDKEREEDEEDYDKELLDRNPGSSDGTAENPQTPPEKETGRRKESKPNNSSQDKTLKKPDKILPCPRCKSMETKFCYYNNYNVNQPRHFCKNCQRYWTSGGTMRNVPVGAGRRKNKSSGGPNHYRHIIVSEALHNGAPTVLAFPPESIASVESKSDPRVPCFPGSHWPYPWSPVPPPPAFCPPGFPGQPFYPGPAYLVPWLPQLSSPNTISSSGLNSMTLGKHSRDEVLRTSGSEEDEPINNSERCLWMPKTLRIDDTREAAKSSTWVALADSHGGRMFKPFRPKGPEKKNHMVYETNSAVHANPAALTRSLNFHEGT